MTIDEAISILESIHRSGSYFNGTADEEALKLGTETLKERKECCEARACERIWLLPGETEE